MHYPDGQLVKIGDRLRLGLNNRCTVVCDIDGNEYSDAHPKEHWGYLGKGVIVMLGSPIHLLHQESADTEMQLLSRAP